MLIRLLRTLLILIIFLAVAYASLWGTLAIWYKLPVSDTLRYLAAGIFGLFGVSTLVGLFGPTRWRWLLVFALLLVVINGWWNTLRPPSEGDWSPELSRLTTGTIDGDTVTIENVRAFEWRSSDDYDPVWKTNTYDLSKIEHLDLFLSYWGGPTMAHFMLSFGFADGEYLSWSIEVRRQAADSFSPVRDFFKAHPIAIVASEERDVVGFRSNIQKAHVRIFRLNVAPQDRRELLKSYVMLANELAEKPHWFNSVFTNCSRTAIQLARFAGERLPTDWRVIVNGYLPNYLYELGLLDTKIPLDDLYRIGDISTRAEAVGLTDEYSNAIREGVPTP